MRITTSSVYGELPGHLGGSEGETHIDSGALKFIMGAAGISSMVDVGCGPGGMVEYARSIGLRAEGIDGDWTVPRNIKVHLHDFTTGTVDLKEVFDLCWCVEFVEHVEEQYMMNYIKVFQQCRFVMMTHAFPGQGGHHHVNEQPTEYWIDRMTKAGFIFEPQMTDQIRKVSTMKQGFIRTHGLFFRNGRV
jgi:cyclopropane fatty-acyl-phospholipid synthase-like methyltransferase